LLVVGWRGGRLHVGLIAVSGADACGGVFVLPIDGPSLIADLCPTGRQCEDGAAGVWRLRADMVAVRSPNEVC